MRKTNKFINLFNFLPLIYERKRFIILDMDADYYQFQLYNKQKEYLNMGQQSSSISKANRLYEMPLSQYILKQRINSALSLWKRKSPPCQQLIQCRMVVNTDEQLKQIYDIFNMRHMHVYLPATRYLTCEQQGIKRCGGYFKGNIYVESAITTLLMINDIPFLDSLHLYSIAFKGFEILFKKFGYFDVFQDMFHICQNGKVKVWCNSQIYKLKPQPYLLDSTGKQQDMIYRIINLIDQNVDKSEPINFKRQLYKKLPNHTHFRSFEHCNVVFREICKENRWQPPQRLRCISQLTKQDLQKLLLQQQSQQNIFKQHLQIQNFVTANTLNHDTINKLGDGKTSLRLSPRNQLFENIPSYRQYKPSIETIQVQKGRSYQDQINQSRQNRIPMYQHNSPTTPTIINQVSSPLRQNTQPFLTVRKYKQDNFVQKKIEPILPISNIRILSVQKRDRSHQNKNIIFAPPIQQNIISKNSSLIHGLAIHNQPVINPKANQRLNINFKIEARPIQNFRSFNESFKIQPNNRGLSPQPLSQNFHRLPSPPHLQQIPFASHNKGKNYLPIQQNQSVKRNPKITFNHNFSSTNQNINNSFKQIPQLPTNNCLFTQTDNKVPQYKTKEIQSPKILKSVILPDNNELQKNSSRRNFQSMSSPMNQDLNKFARTQQTTSKIIQVSRSSSALKRNFIERFQQSLQSQQFGNPFQAILKNNVEHKSESDNSRTQWQIPKMRNEVNQKKRIQYNQTKSEYTDPKLFQMLSSKDISSITINPTFNFTLSHESVTNKQVINKGKLSEQKLSDNQLYFSFSKGGKQKYRNGFQKDKNDNNNSYQQIQQTVVNSQNSENSARKKYEAGIDKQIWSDLVELRKNRAYY